MYDASNGGFPREPPFARVVHPRFEFHTGHVTVGGSICTKMLTTDGWDPRMNAAHLLASVRQILIDGGARVDVDAKYPYDLREAREAFVRVAAHHKRVGW